MVVGTLKLSVSFIVVNELTLFPSDGSVSSFLGNLLKIVTRARYNPSSHHQQGRVNINIVNSTMSTGKDFLIHTLYTN